VSALIDRALAACGLDRTLVARREGRLDGAEVDRLRSADLLVLGALADRVRTEEVGVEVRIFTGEPPSSDAPLVVFPEGDRDPTGLELLREVALARIVGPNRCRVRIDWTRCGLELAQVSLGFGADELVGRIATKRGLLIGGDELVGVGKKSRRELAHDVKRRELAGYVRRAGRVPVFVGPDGRPEAFVEATPILETT
jgi:hypothetical protein